ncbi:hypothetical protein BH11PSE5_BH11PSE5_06510 [soil metagenome]
MKRFTGQAVWIAVALATSSCGGDAASPPVVSPPTQIPTPTPTPTPTPARYNQIGFFNPLGTPAELPSRMTFGMINAYSVEQVEESLTAARGTTYKVKIDFSDLILLRRNPASVSTKYSDSSGSNYSKHFAPLPTQKLASFPEDTVLSEKIRPFILMMKSHEANLGAIFLADEPYLNGISKSEMERAGSVVRRELDNAGLSRVKLGVIFASGMFDQDFARHLDRAAGDYARRTDAYYERGMAIKAGTITDVNFDLNGFDQWVSNVSRSRLTTYDAAGNMYTGGGIPLGYEIVAFDYYLSTILLDDLHVNSLSFLASKFPNGPCGQYVTTGMGSIRGSLSYFQDGSIKEGEAPQNSDRSILNGVYQCRMTATFELLKKVVSTTAARIMVISESSANGVFEYYANGTPKSAQPKLLIEARVYDEVERALNFYTDHRQDIPCGLMFFIFNDAYDYSINLQIYGASSFPSVMNKLYDFSAMQGTSAQNQCD